MEIRKITELKEIANDRDQILEGFTSTTLGGWKSDYVVVDDYDNCLHISSDKYSDYFLLWDNDMQIDETVMIKVPNKQKNEQGE